jgi:hypothetical protein
MAPPHKLSPVSGLQIRSFTKTNTNTYKWFSTMIQAGIMMFLPHAPSLASAASITDVLQWLHILGSKQRNVVQKEKYED